MKISSKLLNKFDYDGTASVPRTIRDAVKIMVRSPPTPGPGRTCEMAEHGLRVPRRLRWQKITTPLDHAEDQPNVSNPTPESNIVPRLSQAG
jgi:hypothetical protein